MTRKFAFACILGGFVGISSFSQKSQAPPPAASTSAGGSAAQNPPDEAEPPEEDEAVKPRTYPFNPLEAERNIKVGNFYMHKGGPSGYRAAAGRYEDATKYNPNSAEAFFKLGEAEEKLKHVDKAQAAFKRVVEIAPDSKLAKDAQKKLAHKG